MRTNKVSQNKIINNLVELYNKKQFLKVLKKSEKLIKKSPSNFIIWNLIGGANQSLGKVNEASKAFKKVTILNPNYHHGHNNLGIVLKEQGKLDEALVAYYNALNLNPNDANTHYNIGVLFQEKYDIEKAIEAYDQSIFLRSNYAPAYNNKGQALKDLGFLEDAVVEFQKAINLDPNYFFAYNNLGNVFFDLGDLKNSIQNFNKAILIKPDFVNALNNLGYVLHKMDKTSEAIEVFNKALFYNNDNANIHFNLGNAFKEKNNIPLAIKSYNETLRLDAYHEKALAKKLLLQSFICDWEAIKFYKDKISNLGLRKDVIPFTLLPLEDNPENHRKRSELFAKLNFSVKEIPFPSIKKEKSKRIRIGYFSSDFKEHPVAYLMAKVFEKHDRNKFEVYGYSIYGFHEDSFSERLKKSFDIFDNVSEMSDKEIAFLARQDNLDIAIDLNGYTENARPKIFAYRAAPIQINYLGYPGTMGADFMDYIIADRNLIPTDKQHFYTEKPIYLPHHYQAQDDSLRIADQTPSKLELGLPDEGFVFCAINSSYKITPREFDIWMRLLKKVDKSVLWLLDFKKGTKENLMNEAVARGVNPSRLVFAKYTSHEKYLAQFRQADLFLDTFNYNAGATASNALWVGLPVLTKSGESYTSRMAGSLLSSIGLNNLITDTEEEYEKVALDLATNPDRLSNLRNELAKNILSKPLFKTQLFIDHLEKGYIQAYQNYLKGQKPQTIFVI